MLIARSVCRWLLQCHRSPTFLTIHVNCFWRPSSISMQPSNRLLSGFQKPPRWTDRNKSHRIGLVLFGLVIWERISKLRYVSQKWISWVMTWTHLSQNICHKKLNFWITCTQIIFLDIDIFSIVSPWDRFTTNRIISWIVSSLGSYRKTFCDFRDFKNWTARILI